MSVVALPNNIVFQGEVNQNRFTLSNNQAISVRGILPDRRWNNTLVHLVDFEDIAQVSTNNCNDTSLTWCVRQRGQG
ncbi:hypothetical protein [Thalassotalea atypica]|uniref:hypothetical protein n=1 Tax=Thalassotalea atypica TaxID=2054316 RepID=UPI002572EDBA|nr:hypothetical protein [Thalassotalea atypica]